MSEVRDPLEVIKEALKDPAEAVPTKYDNDAIARSLMARYAKPTLKDELSKGEENPLA